MEFNILSFLTIAEKCAIRVVGILLLSLLFSDDMVFVATDV